MSPFKSEKQKKYMWANHPKIARRWAEEAKRKHHKSLIRRGRKRSLLTEGR